MHKKHFFNFGVSVFAIITAFISVEFFNAKAADESGYIGVQQKSVLMITSVRGEEVLKTSLGAAKVSLLDATFNLFSDAPKKIKTITLSIHVGHDTEGYDPAALFSKIALMHNGNKIFPVTIISDERTFEPNTIAATFEVSEEEFMHEDELSFVADISDDRKNVGAEIVAYLANDFESVGDQAIEFADPAVEVKGVLSGWTQGTPMGSAIVVTP